MAKNITPQKKSGFRQSAIVALIGRPNVGKSTLFNRITKSRKALVDPTPGVTRDRQYERVDWDEKTFILVDTGGLPRAQIPDVDSHLSAEASDETVEGALEGRIALGPERSSPAEGQKQDPDRGPAGRRWAMHSVGVAGLASARAGRPSVRVTRKAGGPCR